ncbi:MAG: hypothetical protein WAX89_06200 [Alphaproteobacteria bacterium]
MPVPSNKEPSGFRLMTDAERASMPDKDAAFTIGGVTYYLSVLEVSDIIHSARIFLDVKKIRDSA